MAQRIITQARHLRMTAIFLGIGDWHDKDSTIPATKDTTLLSFRIFSPDDTQLVAAKFTTPLQVAEPARA